MTEKKVTKRATKAKVLKEGKVTEIVVKEIVEKGYEPNSMLRFFKYSHLPEALQPKSKAFHDLATKMDKELPNSSEKTAGLRKLLEAKDCFVRAAL